MEAERRNSQMETEIEGGKYGNGEGGAREGERKRWDRRMGEGKKEDEGKGRRRMREGKKGMGRWDEVNGGGGGGGKGK